MKENEMTEAPGMILITAEYPKITGKYGTRGIRHTHIEVEHGAGHEPILILPIGKKIKK